MVSIPVCVMVSQDPIYPIPEARYRILNQCASRNGQWERHIDRKVRDWVGIGGWTFASEKEAFWKLFLGLVGILGWS